MNSNRGAFSTPRLTEPIAMALMGAGFFIFMASLAGGDFWRSLDEKLWRRSFFTQNTVAAGTTELKALVVKGNSPLTLTSTAAERRLALARDMDVLALAGAKVVVLEAWLNDASQGESELLLDHVLDSSSSILKKDSGKFRQQISSLKANLNADKTLAASISRAANVLLPVLVEAQSDTAELSAWPYRGAYQVSLRSKGPQMLEPQWRPSRAPLGVFGNACASLAALAPAARTLMVTDEVLEVPAVFQVGTSWVNSLALEAARLQLEIPSKGLHFLWHSGNLSALELKNTRYPFSAQATFRIPWKRDRPSLLEVKVSSLEKAPLSLLRDLKGKVVFYQPWPEFLNDTEAFQQQRDLFAALAAGHVQMAPASRNDRGLWSLIFMLVLGGLALFRSRLAWILPLALVAGFSSAFFYGQRPIARPLGALSGACFAGLGLRLLKEKRRREASLDRLKGVLDPSALSHWVSLLENENSSGAVIAGAYLAVNSPLDYHTPKLWEAWAKKHHALVDMDSTHRWGFVLPVGSEARLALAAAKELIPLLPAAGFSFALGQIQLRPVALFSSTRWSVDAEAKSEAVQMAVLATTGELLITESDYADLREEVQVQLKGELKVEGALIPEKILNILGLY